VNVKVVPALTALFTLDVAAVAFEDSLNDEYSGGCVYFIQAALKMRSREVLTKI